MPTKTFFNLDPLKQTKILSIATHEFSELPFSEVSINKIVKKSEISRGSFYTYFADKHDLFFYLIEQVKNNLINNINSVFLPKQTDLKDLYILIHKHIYELFNNQTTHKFLINVILYFKSSSEDQNNTDINRFTFLNDCDDLIGLIDTKQFRFLEEKKIKYTIDIANAVLKNVLFTSIMTKLSYDESKSLLEEYFTILQQGYKEE